MSRVNRDHPKCSRTRSVAQRPHTRSVSALVTVDLTRDSPINQLTPTQFEETLPQRGSSVIILEEVIDLSTPKKAKNKRSGHPPKQKSPKKKAENKDTDQGLCSVCLEKLQFSDPSPDQRVMSTQCGHMYCRSCIVPILTDTQMCPKCRQKQTIQDIHPLYM